MLIDGLPPEASVNGGFSVSDHMLAQFVGVTLPTPGTPPPERRRPSPRDGLKQLVARERAEVSNA